MDARNSDTSRTRAVKALGAIGVLGVVAQQVPVLLERRAAAGGVDDDGVERQRLEGVDVAARQIARGLALARVHLQRAAAALPRRAVDDAAVGGQHAHGGGVRLAEELRHDAALDEPHAVARLAHRWRDLGRGPAPQPALRRPEHRLHLLHLLRHQLQHTHFSRERLEP